jgi:PiT family inorganic phosphate transporter
VTVDHILEGLQNFGQVDFLALPPTVLGLIALALVFDYLNGFHDAANSIATVVSTRVLTPRQAVLWAAFFNFIAFLVFHLTVAATMGKGIIDPKIVDYAVIAATLTAACAWDLITWYYGLPTSSSHALIGGMVGAALAKAGSVGHTGSPLVWEGILKTMQFIILAPFIGFLVGMFIAIAVTWTFRHATPRRVEGLFRKGQLLSAALYSLGHGGNDAQKTMGVIYVLLIAATYTNGSRVLTEKSPVPTEIVLACHVAMGVGTLFGGWRIVKTMGQRLIKLRPVDGFCAETGAAVTLVMTIFGGIPVSTTHTITGAIVGVGSARYRFSAVRWGVAGRVVWAWVLTIPGAAAISAVSWYGLRYLF